MVVLVIQMALIILLTHAKNASLQAIKVIGQINQMAHLAVQALVQQMLVVEMVKIGAIIQVLLVLELAQVAHAGHARLLLEFVPHQRVVINLVAPPAMALAIVQQLLNVQVQFIKLDQTAVPRVATVTMVHGVTQRALLQYLIAQLNVMVIQIAQQGRPAIPLAPRVHALNQTTPLQQLQFKACQAVGKIQMPRLQLVALTQTQVVTQVLIV